MGASVNKGGMELAVMPQHPALKPETTYYKTAKLDVHVHFWRPPARTKKPSPQNPQTLNSLPAPNPAPGGDRLADKAPDGCHFGLCLLGLKA